MRPDARPTRRITRLLVITALGLLVLYRVGDVLEYEEQRKELLWVASTEEEATLGRPSDTAKLKRLGEAAVNAGRRRNGAVMELVLVLCLAAAFVWVSKPVRQRLDQPSPSTPDKPA